MFDLAPYAAAIVAAVVAFATAYFKGRKDANTKNKLEKVEANEQTHERMDHLPPVDPSDHDDIIERLRDQGERKRRS
jgi:hypothetical protein|tara:strand:- start:267 stop:497 length:231 start_codon:yes stop_codon:yes gene_type:complete